MVAPLLAALGIYLFIGFLFGIPFAFAGAKVIDPAAVKGSLGFKLLIIPGCAIFWPYLLKRWVQKAPPSEECTAHRALAKRSNH